MKWLVVLTRVVAARPLVAAVIAAAAVTAAALGATEVAEGLHQLAAALGGQLVVGQ